MANPPRAKGTTGENEILELLHHHGMTDAHRTESSRESHDIHLAPFIVEVKYRRKWRMFEWISKIRSVAGTAPWVIYAIHGDRRTAEGKAVGRVAILDAELATWLIAQARRRTQTEGSAGSAAPGCGARPESESTER